MSIVWRLASGRYPALDGEGARLAGGRWNSAGQSAVYTSESLALCLAEALVHLPGALPRDYVAFKIHVPDDTITVIDASSLKRGWARDLAYARAVGDKWLDDKRSLALRVPSLVLPKSINVILNPLHPRAVEMRVIKQQPFDFDPRLRPPS
ncbi:MAG TPA: RES family NAD+ phosphorylase [Pyrinomonadaceae bacterium]|nr:RES family NAD+ phosphorylase [Pyrinomonadaceae bacterium]